MSAKTKNQSVWCDNGHEPILMIYSHDTIMENSSIYICSLCHAEKYVKESVWNGRISIEWKSKPDHMSTPRNT